MATATRDLEALIRKAHAHEERAPVITGDDLRAAREAAGLRPVTIARWLNVSRQYVNRLEHDGSVSLTAAEEYVEAIKGISAK